MPGRRLRGFVTGAPLAWALALALCAGPAAGEEASGWDAGFLGSADETLAGQDRLRVLGPLFESRHGEDGSSFFAIRPLFSREKGAGGEWVTSYTLWPLGWHRRRAGESDWRMLIASGHDFDTADPESRRRFWLLPVLFSGRDIEGEDYFAVFPLGGTIHEFLGQDRMSFVLFPLYYSSTTDDLHGESWLWPIVSWAEGGDVHRFRIFPFYGQSVNEGRWVKRFVLWPFWTSVRYDYPRMTGGGFVLFPLYGRLHIENRQDTWLVIPPLFRWSRTDDGDVEANLPWPLVRYSSGPVRKLYLWPLWGRKAVGNVRSSFLLWPLGRFEEVDRRDSVIHRDMVLPFYYSELRAPKAEGEPPSERYLKLWPLFSYWREKDVARCRVPDLWPLKNTAGMERNWAPLWTLFSHSAAGTAHEEEVLWGLYRRRVNADGSGSVSVFPLFSAGSAAEPGGARSSRWSLLYGLLGRERDGLQSEWRMCYLFRWRTGARPETPAGAQD